MRFISLSVRNYRIHRELSVEFDPGRNLIGGPNESGKSTLAEAVHRVLFMRHKAGGELQKSMISEIHAGHPEVRLSFEAGGETWTIEKVFAGSSKGSARLSSAKGVSLQGDAAEEKLAELTGTNEPVASRGNDLLTRWAHLWVWQGKSIDDVSNHVDQHRSELIQRLQDSGLAAVMQSETDDLTREKVRARHDLIFTKTGAIKVGSRLDLATRALDEAAAALRGAEELKARLESAVAAEESAIREIGIIEQALPGYRDQLAAAKLDLGKARELEGLLDKQKLIHSQAAGALREIEKADQQIREFVMQAGTAREALIPAEKDLDLLTTQVAASAVRAEEARLSLQNAVANLRGARQQHDLANACVARFEKAAAHQTVTAKAEVVAGMEKTLAEDRDALSRLPGVSPDQLEALRQLESRLAQAGSALEAIATGIELVSAPQEVILNGKKLPPGEPQVITEASELVLADGTRVRIQPGGGNSLGAAREKYDKLAGDHAAMLDRLAIKDVQQAAEVLARRQTLDARIASTRERLKDLGAAGLQVDLTESAAALAAAAAELERRLAALPAESDIHLPLDLTSARAWLGEISERLAAEEQAEQSRRTEAEAAHRVHQEKITALEAARQTLDGRRREIAERETAARTLEDIHGDAADRGRKILDARAAEAAAKVEVDSTSARLADLHPEDLGREVSRLENVISREQSKLQDASTRLAVARNALILDGSADPGADLLQARARHAVASETHAREKRHADAIELLHRLFTESQNAISRSVTEPIADRVTGYLECVLGRGVRIDVDWTDSARKSGIQITRPGAPTFSFDVLSGGAREQVAAAVRLATAEILAASHDGCLPVLFDDSFAFSDHERSRSLQKMLYLASTRGLQVHVLTCTPEAYSDLAAHEIRLTGRAGVAP